MSALAVVTKPADQRTDDPDLVAAVRAGDDRAFELLFLRYQSRITAYVRGMVRDHERAEDITQDVFIAALRRLRETDAHIAFKPWIYEIAKNACIDAFRRSRNTNEVSLQADEGIGPSMVASGGGPDAVVDAKLAIDNLCGAFGGLSQAHHDILVMREFEGRTYQEIGERLGMSRAGVESTLFRARRRLGEEYEELVSGERCVRVRGIVDAPPGRAVGLRDQRRMDRHLAHCQPCRRYACLAGVELGEERARSVAARIAALLPLPTFVRRRFDIDDAGQFLGQHSAPALHWTTKVIPVLDPTTIAAWPRMLATTAGVAVAGLGAGAAVGERDTLKSLVSKPPAVKATIAPPKAAVVRAPGSRPAAAAPVDGQPPAPAAAGDVPDESGPHAGGETAREPAASQERPAASAPAGSEPSSAPGSDPVADAVTDVGQTVPAVPDVSEGAALAGEPDGEAPRRRPVGDLLEGMSQGGTGPGAAADGGDDASAGADAGADADPAELPDRLGNVVHSLGNAIAHGTSGSAGATGTASPAGTGSATSGPLATIVGQALGGVAGSS